MEEIDEGLGVRATSCNLKAHPRTHPVADEIVFPRVDEHILAALEQPCDVALEVLHPVARVLCEGNFQMLQSTLKKNKLTYLLHFK